MEHIIKKIKNGAKHTRLSATEKADMRSALVRHMKANPVDSAVLNAQGIPSPFFNINNFRNKKGISILVIVGLLMGGTVSIAAENAVPGDALFTVKVHVNENVRGAMAVTSKAKAEWEVKLVERRLEEVEKLAMTPSAIPEVQQVAERNLEHYAERVKNRIEKFDNDEDDEDALHTASNLSNVFNAHEQVLVVMSANVATTTPVASAPVVSNESIKGTLKKVQGARGDAEKKHKELKEKYNKEKVEESVKIETKKPSSTTTTTKNSKSRASDNNRKQKELKSFRPGRESADSELRSTVTNAQTTSTPSVLEKSEPKKEENKKREEARREESESDDND